MNDSFATRVLLVADDEHQMVSTRQLLRDASPRYTLAWTPHYAEGLQRLLQGEADAALIDDRLSTRSGLDLVRDALANSCGVPLIILTALEDEAVDRQAIEIGAADSLRKSQLTPDLLDRTLRWAIRHQETLARLRRAQAE